MATRKRASNGRFVKSASTPRRRTASRASTGGRRRRTSYKNKSIAGVVASVGLGLGVLASPVTGKVIASVKGKSPAPLMSWSKDDIKNTAIKVGIGAIGGKIAGQVLNKVTPVKHVTNRALRLVKGLI